ncbi:hypothetical protein LCGC14_1838260 [marine sediment metagenome]|uniref:HNH nuclease domain-containing protein n=1 Tax=marine sediment metagenome TaxID=412755 RepID=A0A0F9GE23_9ZZZZ
MGKSGWHHDEETKKRIAGARKAYFADMSSDERATFGNKVSMGVKKTVDAMSGEERNQKFGHSETSKRFYREHPEVAIRISRALSETRRSLSLEDRGQWARNAAEACRVSPLRAMSYNDEWRQRISESVKLLWTDEKRREQGRRALEQWVQGRWGSKTLGHTRNNYPSNWEFIKIVIRERDGNACRLCGLDGVLHIHHINYDTFDCRWENLITLCDSHHARTNYDREYWQELLSGKIREEGEKVIA